MRAGTVPRVTSEGWPAYLRSAMKAAGISNQAELARRLGVSDSDVSRWLKGIVQPQPPQLRKMTTVLRRPMLELLVAAGHLEPDEAGMEGVPQVPAPRVADVLDAIAEDDRLLPEAKDHLRNQYGLLLRVQAKGRVPDVAFDLDVRDRRSAERRDRRSADRGKAKAKDAESG